MAHHIDLAQAGSDKPSASVLDCGGPPPHLILAVPTIPMFPMLNEMTLF
jgi:hypothetical protein